MRLSPKPGQESDDLIDGRRQIMLVRVITGDAICRKADPKLEQRVSRNQLQISYCEYLSTAHSRERYVGKWDAFYRPISSASFNLSFAPCESEWGVLGAIEQRVKVSPTRVRIQTLSSFDDEDQAGVSMRTAADGRRDSLAGRHLLRHRGTRRGLLSHGAFQHGLDHRFDRREPGECAIAKRGLLGPGAGSLR